MSIDKKILIAGPFPDPVGGVSVHITRLKEFLENYFCIISIDESPIKKDGIFNIRSLNFVHYIRCFFMADLVHIHSSIPLFRFIHCVLAFLLRKKIVVTLHSYRKQSLINRVFNKISLAIADKVIAVSDRIARDSGVACEVIPAFISPSSSELKLEPEWTSLFNECRSKNKKILISNAYRLDDVENRDLYGFDQILDLFTDLEVQNDWVAILNVSSLSGCEGKFNEFNQYIINNDLSGKVFLFNKKVSFSGMLKESDVFIRATLTDGDALSIRESLLLGVKTIASDCVERPIGTLIYKTSDVQSLKRVLYTQEVQKTNSCRSFERDILSLYKGLL